MERIACTWCKQIYDSRLMRMRRGLDICEVCDDRMREYELDAKREQWEAEQEEQERQEYYAELEESDDD